MFIVEIVDGNRTHHARLEANGFTHREDLDYYENRRAVTDSGDLVEVWEKDNGSSQVTKVDFGDLPEIEEE